VDRSKGTYALVVVVEEETTIEVGRLGTFSFPRGYYVYLGSALGSLFPRLRRHLSGSGKTRWHIDYLRRHARVVEVWYAVSEERLECSWHRAIADMTGGETPIAGFGSSDCKCSSHLVYFPFLPSLQSFKRRLERLGVCSPAAVKTIRA